MDISKRWIYIDDINNIWKFSLDSDNKLKYSIMYKEGKWTKEKLVDENVLEYSMYTDKSGIHIIYSNRQAELKYCTFIEEQWMGKVLYKLEDENVEINNLNVLLIDDEKHIFFLVIDKESDGHGILVHFSWKEKETKFDKLQDIILAADLEDHYLVDLDENKDIDLLFLSDEGNEISLNHLTYENFKWTDVRRLYGIYGEDIEVKILKDQYGIHVINKYKEDSLNHLIHVLVKKDGSAYKLDIHESENKLRDPILLKERNEIILYWIEEKKVYSSSYNGKEWSPPLSITEESEEDIIKYKYIEFNREKKGKEVYASGEVELKFLVSHEEVKIQEQAEIYQIEENLETINKEKIFQMEETIARLNLQLQKKEKDQEEYENQISRIAQYKQGVEKNYNIFMEVQNKLQRELEESKKIHEEEIIKRENIEVELRDSKEARKAIEKLLDSLKEENSKLIEENNRLTEENTRLNLEVDDTKKKSSLKGFWKF